MLLVTGIGTKDRFHLTAVQNTVAETPQIHKTVGTKDRQKFYRITERPFAILTVWQNTANYLTDGENDRELILPQISMIRLNSI